MVEWQRPELRAAVVFHAVHYDHPVTRRHAKIRTVPDTPEKKFRHHGSGAWTIGHDTVGLGLDTTIIGVVSGGKTGPVGAPAVPHAYSGKVYEITADRAVRFPVGETVSGIASSEGHLMIS